MTHSKLREILKKWRKLALKKAYSFSDQDHTSGGRGGGSTGQTRRSISLPSVSYGSMRGSEGGSSRGSGRVPAGHLAVYVGEERRRFVIKTRYLSHPLFRALLKKTEEEMGFQQEGALAIPCPVSFFEHLLRIIAYCCKSHHHINLIPSLLQTTSPHPGSSHHLQTAAVGDQQLHEALLLQLLQLSSDQLGRHDSVSDLSDHHAASGIRSCSYYQHSVSAGSLSQLPVVL